MKWPFVKIGEVCKRTSTRDPRRTPENSFKYIDISSVDREQKCIVSTPEIIGSEAPSRARKEVKYGDILVSTVRPNLNSVALVPQELDNQVASTGFCVLRPQVQINRKYLFYFTTSKPFIEILTAKVRGAHYPAVSNSDVKNVEIPLPPPSEQRQIVELLDQADQLRKLRSEADKKAERILPSLFIKAFGDPATNPMGWHISPIRSFVSPIERGDPRSDPDKYFQYIDIAGIDDRKGHIVEIKTILGAAAPSRARQIVQANDVIISTVRPYLRATALVPKELNRQICSTGFCILRAQKHYGFGFLYVLSRLQWFTGQLNASTRGAAYPAVSDGDILKLKIPLPKKTEMFQSFDKRVLEVIKLRKKKEKSAITLDRLFSSILHKAFTGDLTASWRQAHMNELLQEMEIQAKALAL